MRLIATLGVVAALFVLGCHNNKPAQTPADQQQQQPTQPAPVQGPPP
jgi:hypothetical protein